MKKLEMFKMMNGDDVITYCIYGLTSEFKVFEKPMIIGLGKTPTGTIAAQLIPWSFITPEASWTVREDSIMGILKDPIPHELEKSYLEGTTGIQLV